MLLLFTGQTEPISFIELWRLTTFNTDEKFSQKLKHIYLRLIKIGKDEQNEPNDYDPFESLAEWKTVSDTECLHEHLFDVMREEGLANKVREIEGKMLSQKKSLSSC